MMPAQRLLGPAPGNLRLLRGDLRANVDDASLRLGDLRLSLLHSGEVVALIELDEDARRDLLVVGDRYARNVAAQLGADRELTRVDEGVVGTLEMAGVEPPLRRADEVAAATSIAAAPISKGWARSSPLLRGACGARSILAGGGGCSSTGPSGTSS